MKYQGGPYKNYIIFNDKPKNEWQRDHHINNLL